MFCDCGSDAPSFSDSPDSLQFQQSGLNPIVDPVVQLLTPELGIIQSMHCGYIYWALSNPWPAGEVSLEYMFYIIQLDQSVTSSSSFRFQA